MPVSPRFDFQEPGNVNEGQGARALCKRPSADRIPQVRIHLYLYLSPRLIPRVQEIHGKVHQGKNYQCSFLRRSTVDHFFSNIP